MALPLPAERKARARDPGRYPALSLKLARTERDKRETMAALGQSPAEQKRLAKVAAADATTVTEFGERFFREIVAKDRADLTIPRRYFDKSIVPAIGTKPVRDVTTEDVRAIIWRKKDEGFDAAAGEIRGVLKRFFDYAMTAGLVKTNPVLALPMRHVHKAKSRERALSADEIRVFLRAAFESNIRRQFKIGLHLILLTMVRKSELLLARWQHVDFEQAEWHIPAEYSKTGKPHIVFLSTQAGALFKELHALAGGSELVMPGRGSLTKPFAHNAINTALKTALAGQPIPAFTIHDLRRTAFFHSAARKRVAFGRGREGAEPHHRRRARGLQPRRIRAAAPGDVAVLGRLHRAADEHRHCHHGPLQAGGLNRPTKFGAR